MRGGDVVSLLHKELDGVIAYDEAIGLPSLPANEDVTTMLLSEFILLLASGALPRRVKTSLGENGARLRAKKFMTWGAKI